MNIFIASIFTILIAQTPPNLPSPTPWSSPTPQIVASDEVDIAEGLNTLSDYLATTEAEIESMPSIEAPSGVSAIANAFGFLKWLSQSDRALLGPFAPLFSFLLQFTAVVLFLLSAWVIILLVTTIYSIATDLWKKITDILPG